MRKYLISPEIGWHKANLHTHSTVSDGKYTPEQLKEKYKALGYDVLAITDHEKLVSHADLTDSEFVAITGYEFARGLESKNSYTSLHLCLWAEDPLNDANPMQGLELGFSADRINAVVRRAHERGFLICLNHPEYSLLPYSEYIRYRGFDYLEVYNACSVPSGLRESDCRLDDMLRAGIFIRPIATDDAHNDANIGLGWLMIGAEKLDYKSIFDALRAGNTYASEGPEIKALYIEDGILKIECSAAEEIYVKSGNRYAGAEVANYGKSLFRAEFPLRLEDEDENRFAAWGDFRHYGYIRVVVRDHTGRKAYTNPYTVEELRKIVAACGKGD